MRICRATYDAIDGDKYSFWRAAFRGRFALLPGMVSKDLRALYQRRAKYLRRGCVVKFQYGAGWYERRVLDVLTGLIQGA